MIPGAFPFQCHWLDGAVKSEKGAAVFDSQNIIGRGEKGVRKGCLLYTSVNKRISVTPIALVGGAACHTSQDFVTIAKTLARA